MNRLTSITEGLHLRQGLTNDMLAAKTRMRIFISDMERLNYTISRSEMNLLAHMDAAADELLNVYHILTDNVPDECDKE